MATVKLERLRHSTRGTAFNVLIYSTTIEPFDDGEVHRRSSTEIERMKLN